MASGAPAAASREAVLRQIDARDEDPRDRELATAIAELPQRQREALVLRSVYGLSHDDAATALAVSPARVETLVRCARRRLRERLGYVPSLPTSALAVPSTLKQELADALAGLATVAQGAPGADADRLHATDAFAPAAAPRRARLTRQRAFPGVRTVAAVPVVAAAAVLAAFGPRGDARAPESAPEAAAAVSAVADPAPQASAKRRAVPRRNGRERLERPSRPQAQTVAGRAGRQSEPRVAVSRPRADDGDGTRTASRGRSDRDAGREAAPASGGVAPPAAPVQPEEDGTEATAAPTSGGAQAQQKVEARVDLGAKKRRAAPEKRTRIDVRVQPSAAAPPKHTGRRDDHEAERGKHGNDDDEKAEKRSADECEDDDDDGKGGDGKVDDGEDGDRDDNGGEGDDNPVG